MPSASRQIVREADDDADWRAAGYSSSAQWLAHLCAATTARAARITRDEHRASESAGARPRNEQGGVVADQVAAAAEFAWPESDAELARVAVGKPPSAISLTARTLAPPRGRGRPGALPATGAEHDVGRVDGASSRFSGRLPLEQGAIFEQAIWDIAKQQRAVDKQAGSVIDWHQSAADALVTLAKHAAATAGEAESTTLIVHLSDDAPPLLEGAGPISPETAARLTCDARRLTIKLTGRDLVHSRVGRCASYAQIRALHNARTTASTPAVPQRASSRGITSSRTRTAGGTELDEPDPALPQTPQAPARPAHPHERQRRRAPCSRTQPGRAITTNQPHAPPR